MSTKWNFKNNAAQAQHYRPLDTNPDDYKSSSSQQNQYNSQDSYKEGVLLSFVDGSTYRTREFTVNDIYDALHTEKKQWLKLQNGGEINLHYIERYIPFKFFNYPKYSYRGSQRPYRNNYGY